jgi:hypothetical protein
VQGHTSHKSVYNIQSNYKLLKQLQVLPNIQLMGRIVMHQKTYGFDEVQLPILLIAISYWQGLPNPYGYELGFLWVWVQVGIF